MKELTGETHTGDPFTSFLVVDVAKAGKTATLIAQLLGVYPGQKYGGVVDQPAHLHVVTFDEAAVTGVPDFLVKSCKAPPECLKFRIYNMQSDVKNLSNSGWDYTFINTLMQVQQTISNRVAREGGVHAVVVSSITTLGAALKRSLSGNPADSASAEDGRSKKGVGMDRSKWDALGLQTNEVRNWFQSDRWHCFWEGHVYKPESTGEDGKVKKESLQLQGSAGRNFANNVAILLRFHRYEGERLPGFNVDRVEYLTQFELEFLVGGRAVNEKLDPKEKDLTVMLHKLGCKIGRWGAPKVVKAVK